MNKWLVRLSCAGLLFTVLVLLLDTPARARGDGASLYKLKCADCHGADGSGNTAVGKSLKLRDLRSADVQKQTDEELTAITANGKGSMPAYKDELAGGQIRQLVGFMRQLAKKK